MPRSTTYYLEIDGTPSCVSPRHPLASPIWSCAQSSHREAQQEALLVWRDHPDAVIAIREGRCPRRDEADPYEEWDDYEP